MKTVEEKKDTKVISEAADMAAIQKQVDDVLAKAQQAADKIIAVAQKKADMIAKDEDVKTEVDPDAAKKKKAEMDAYLNEKVPVFLFKDNNKYKDAVHLVLNGEDLYIKRGVHTTIPRKFYQLWMNSQAQDAYSANHNAALQDEYRAKETRLS